MYMICVPGIHVSQKKVSDILELELQTVSAVIWMLRTIRGPLQQQPVLLSMELLPLPQLLSLMSTEARSAETWRLGRAGDEAHVTQ